MAVSPATPPPASREGRRPLGRRWLWIFGVLMVVGTAAVLVVRRVIAHAEPIIRARVIESLETRFKTKVELAELDVSVVDGLQVSGKGLKIFGPADPNPSEPGVQPLISLPEFRFRTGVFGLFRTPMHVDTVQLQGLVLNIPPKEDRPRVNEPGSRASKHKEKISITVDKFVCRDTQLIVNTRKPGKEPLDFDISDLVLREIGPGQPLRFDATLVNPKPVGNIQSEGSFGPFREDDPGESPVSGNYSFTHADLGTLKGISGILSSTGSYRGKLGKIEVEGATDTPDFRLASAGHPVALHTDFHAIVDGTDGDTYLEPVRARFLHTSFTANGKVIRVKDPPGHDIELNVVMDHARIEDLLQLGVKTDPPVLSGDIEMHTRMSLPPGPEEVANRLWLDGSFRIPNGEFSNKKIQDHIDSLSLRSQGEPRLAQEHVEVGVPSELSGTFRLDQGLFTFSSLQFVVPGTHADVTGVYSLDGNTFDFHGKLKLQATLSQMTTGWKSLLLKAVDPFFKKDGAGAEIPFKVTGTRSEPHFGLDLGGSKNEAAEQKLSKPETR